MTHRGVRRTRHQGDDEVYFQVVCDPGHHRTARELSALPQESRARVWADMIGSTSENGSIHAMSRQDETPESIEEKLQELDQEIHRLQPGNGRDLVFDTRIAQDREFRLGFLRASIYSPREAARQLSRHLELKALLFGRDKVEGSIRLEDLSDDDVETLKCGALQFLPQTDQGGRLVFVSRYQELVYKNPENILRVLWYMWMSALETPTVDNTGIIVVGYEVSDSQVTVDYEILRKMLHVARSLPIRVKAAHSCYSASPMAQAVDVVVHMVTSFIRLRLRLHCGSHQECRYRLLTVGVPVDLMPVTLDGGLRVENHVHWLNYRIRQEGTKKTKRYEQECSSSASRGYHVIESDDEDTSMDK